jgi:hypothetical protein
MRVAQITPLWEQVPPVGYGGTESVVSLLTEELVREGIRSPYLPLATRRPWLI